MLLHLDYRDSRPIYVQIMDALRQQIASGVLRQEEKLPSRSCVCCGNLTTPPGIFCAGATPGRS